MNVEDLVLKAAEQGERKKTAFQQMATAVILQAWIDANHWRASKNRADSRRFLTGQTPEWRESLEAWCECCEKDPQAIMKVARNRFLKSR